MLGSNFTSFLVPEVLNAVVQLHGRNLMLRKTLDGLSCEHC